MVAAVGRLRGPEADLARDYAARATAAGRALGLGPAMKTSSYSRMVFADRIAAWRDGGERRIAFLVGGADGLDPALVARARETLAFGPQTWPHALARAMLAEQLYRAVTILGGSPYHRD